VYFLNRYRWYAPPWYSVTTSLRSPVFASDSFSIAAVSRRRALNDSSADVPAGTAALTRAVTSSIDCSTFSSRSTQRISSAAVRAWKPSCRRFFFSVETFCNASAPTWWFEITRPSSETNEPDPPELNRTDDFIRWSSQASVSSKPYFARICSLGGSV